MNIVKSGPKRICDKQIQSLKYLISVPHQGSAILKKLLLFLIDSSKNMTKEVHITLTEGVGYSSQDIERMVKSLGNMQSPLGVVHLDDLLKLSGSVFMFSVQQKYINEHKLKKCTFWLSEEKYSSTSTKVFISPQGLEKIHLETKK